MNIPQTIYSKSMIDLIHEIRHRMPAELRSGVRFSNPDIFSNMVIFYNVTDDSVAKCLIKTLLTEAGGSWLTLLMNESSQNKKGRDKRQNKTTSQELVKVYRGQASVVNTQKGIDVKVREVMNRHDTHQYQAPAI